MAITTLDAAAAGARPPQPIIKIGASAGPAPAGGKGWTARYSPGMPPAAAAPTPGVNGEAVTAAVATSEIPRVNPAGGQNAYLHRLSMQCNQPGQFWLIDRLWQNSGLSTTLTTAQAITPVVAAARDLNGAGLGHGVMAAIEWSAAGGAGTPTYTLTYTDESGNAGSTSTMVSMASPPAGTIEVFPWAAGDVGVRSIQSIIASATHTSGAFHLILFRLIASLEVPASNVASAIDFLTGGAPRIYDNSALGGIWWPSAAATISHIGSYIETQG